MTSLPDGPFNTPPGTTWRELDPPERRRDEDDDFWTDYWLYQGTEPEDKLYEQ